MIRAAFRLLLLCIPTLGILAILGGILLTLFDSQLAWPMKAFMVAMLAWVIVVASVVICPGWPGFVKGVTGGHDWEWRD